MTKHLAPWLLAAIGVLLGACAGSGLHMVTLPPERAPAPAFNDEGSRTLRVLTLNLAHGRGEGTHQIFLDDASIRANLDQTAAVLRSHAPDLVALQEADAPSFWSGGFDHVVYLGKESGLAHIVHGEHVSGPALSYGTALLSRLKLENPETLTFDPERVPVPKGFVAATIRWPGATSVSVDVVSLHLDFLTEAARRAQASELIAMLQQRGHPVILMGDFNSDWHKPDSAVRYIARELCLSTYNPGAQGLSTFPRFDSRLDWVLVSGNLEFLSYQVLPDALSDHRGVLAEIILSKHASRAKQTR